MKGKKSILIVFGREGCVCRLKSWQIDGKLLLKTGIPVEFTVLLRGSDAAVSL